MRTASTYISLPGESQPDSLYLTQRNFILCPIVELGRSRRLMASHLLGMLEPAVVFQVNGDACCSPGVTSDGGEKPCRFGPLPNCSPGVVAIQIHSTSRYLRSSRINALKQWLTALKSCGLNVFVQDLLEQVMYGHIMLLAAFFVECQPPTGTIMIVIVDFEFQYCAHSDEAVRTSPQ
jgi:hypothetical protein